MSNISTVRRSANKAGYRLVKYRKPPQGYCNYNLYDIERNFAVGYGFDTLDEVVDWLKN